MLSGSPNGTSAVGSLHRVLHRDLDATLQLTDVVHVRIDARLVASAEMGLERAELIDDRVENARVALSIAPSFFRARAIAKQPLEHHARVDLRRQRLRGRRPRDRVGVRAAVAPVAVAEVAHVLDAELQRRENRVLPVLVGDVLIDSDSQERAHRVASRPRSGQQHRAARVIATRLVRRRHRLRHVEAADEDHAVAKWLERLRDKREVEVLPVLERTPVARRCAVRVPDADEATHRRRSGHPRGRQRRQHRLEQRQRQRDAGTAQKRSSSNVSSSSNEHRLSPRHSNFNFDAPMATANCSSEIGTSELFTLI